MKRKPLLANRANLSSIEISDQSYQTLSVTEKSKIISMFPEYENQVQLFAVGQIESQGTQYENGICAISMHYVGFFWQSPENVKKIAFFNILSLIKFVFSHSNKHQRIYLETETTDASLSSGPVLLVSRFIYRNYSLSTFPLQENKKTVFYSYDKSIFPPIQFPLSISQLFQFRVAALFSQNELQYDHLKTQFFHSYIQSHNPIMNLKNLRINQHELYPFFQTIVHFPQISGIVCKDCDYPSILSQISTIVEESKFLKIIKIINCNSKDGIYEFARSLESNKSLPLEQLYICQNQIDDFTPLFSAISQFHSKLSHFSITGSHLLIQNLLSCESLCCLKHLGIGGCECTNTLVQELNDYINLNKNLVSLDISGSRSIKPVLSILIGSSIKHLNLSNCEFDEKSIEALKAISPFLTKLDLSSTNLDHYSLSDVISLLGKSRQDLLRLKLNHIDLSKEKSLLIIRGLLNNNLKKWKRIELDDTHLSIDELYAYQAVFNHMPNLTFLSMGHNFEEKDAHVVSLLTEIQSLRTLRLSNSKLSSIVPQIAASKNLVDIDLSYNNLSDEDAILLLSCEHIEKLNIDGIQFIDEHKVIESTFNTKPHLTQIPFCGGFVPLKPINKPFKMESIENMNVLQHSCICEDLSMPYPCGSQPYEKQGVEIGDPNIYHTFHMNMIVVEKSVQPKKIEKLLNYPIVEQNKEDFDNDDSSDISIDELVNMNLVSSLSETLFTGLGGTFSDSSDNDIAKVRKNSSHPIIKSEFNKKQAHNDDPKSDSSISLNNDIKLALMENHKPLLEEYSSDSDQENNTIDMMLSDMQKRAGLNENIKILSDLNKKRNKSPNEIKESSQHEKVSKIPTLRNKKGLSIIPLELSDDDEMKINLDDEDDDVVFTPSNNTLLSLTKNNSSSTPSSPSNIKTISNDDSKKKQPSSMIEDDEKAVKSPEYQLPSPRNEEEEKNEKGFLKKSIYDSSDSQDEAEKEESKSATPTKKFFGSIYEESSAAMQQTSPIRKIPPPPISSQKSTGSIPSPKFSFTEGNTDSQKKDGSQNKQNPIILAFSPPNLP